MSRRSKSKTQHISKSFSVLGTLQKLANYDTHTDYLVGGPFTLKADGSPNQFSIQFPDLTNIQGTRTISNIKYEVIGGIGIFDNQNKLSLVNPGHSFLVLQVMKYGTPETTILNQNITDFQDIIVNNGNTFGISKQKCGYLGFPQSDVLDIHPLCTSIFSDQSMSTDQYNIKGGYLGRVNLEMNDSIVLYIVISGSEFTAFPNNTQVSKLGTTMFGTISYDISF